MRLITIVFGLRRIGAVARAFHGERTFVEFTPAGHPGDPDRDSAAMSASM
ncbi:hypothetical protein [Saccharothrix luteola]|nr:hypothetical protein [Saccharothrix luteola]MCC8247059.1 hypothetical protein [Saccharothrix luteola]MCC8249900.1 hypothetical protein [Saccharothrix luteola]